MPKPNSFRLKNLFTLDRFFAYTGSNYRHLVDRTVKSVWFKQVLVYSGFG